MDHDATARLRRQLAAFAQFTSRPLGKSELDSIMLDACLRARSGMGVSHAKLLEYLPDRDGLFLRAGVGWKSGYVGKYITSTRVDSVIGQAFAYARPVAVQDYRERNDIQYPAILVEHGCVSSLNVPVSTDDGTFGVLEVDHIAVRTYSDDDIYFLTGLGNTIAQAILLRRNLYSLSRALEEKQLFAREMNHRIKNNLSLVGSMLALQSRRIQDPAVRSELQNAIQRIHNLALVHDRLQMFSQMNAEVDAHALFEDVASMLRSMLPAGVRLTTMCSGSLPGDCIESLTLLANELVTNAAKYAFKGRETGEIIIGFRQEGAGWRFWVEDDGIGMPDHDPAKASFGTQLIGALVTRINAVMHTLPTNGTHIEISFGVPTR